MQADDYMKRYLPDFDTAEKRANLQEFSKEELIEKLLKAYKDARLMAMTADLLDRKLSHIARIANEPTVLPNVDQPPPNFPEA